MRALFALFVRSLREDSRAKLPPILRTALVVITLLILWANHRSFTYRSGAGRELLFAVMMLNAAFLAVAAVSIFPSAITEEKEDETLPLLRMTDLNPFSILLGKAAPRLLAAVLLLAAQIPFTLLAVTLGGVTKDQVLGAYAILGATTVFFCGVALFASVFCRTVLRAGLMTGMISAILYVGLPLLTIATSLRRMSPAMLVPTTVWEYMSVWIMESNPVYGLGMLIGRDLTTVVLPVVWRNLLGGLLFALLSWVLFDRFCAGLEERAPRPAKLPSSRPRRAWAAVPRAWGWPLVWKDFYFMAGGRAGFLLRLLVGALMFFSVFGYYRWIDPPMASGYRDNLAMGRALLWEQVSEVVMVLAAWLAGLELVLLASRLFGVERRQQTLASIVGLPRSIGNIFWQKLLGCLGVLLPWMLLAAAGAGAWMDQFPEVEQRSYYYSHRANAAEVFAICYVVLQALLLLTVIIWFSLLIRRGAVPAGIATIAVWNVLFFVVLFSGGNGSGIEGLIFFGDIVTFFALLFFGRAVSYRIETAAAED